VPDLVDIAPTSRDSDDDYLVALAAFAKARALVSGGRDLTEMGHRGSKGPGSGLSGSMGNVPQTKPRVTRRQLTPADVRAELEEWEAKYGVASDHLADAFWDPTTGALTETNDFHNWSQAYDAWLHVSVR
jgi:hypothetical protein